MKISIVTDTDASLPKELTAKYNIIEVPIVVQFGNETLYTNIDINDEKLFERVERENKLPTTSAPSPGAFAAAYDQAFKAGAEAVLCFCVSSAVSATYAAALTARDTMPEKDITVIDTQSLTMGQGFMVLAAAEAVAQGATKEEAIARAKEVGERTYLYASLATLKYLAMSGRVGSVTAGIANILNIKPVLTIRDGKLDLLERVRTQSKSWERAVELVGAKVGSKKIERLAMVHVDALENAKTFEALLRSKINCPNEVLYSELTPGLSVHSGIGLVGVAFTVSK